MMMISSLKLVLIFGAALGLYQSFNAQNKNHLAGVVPQYNTNNTDQPTTLISALQVKPGFDYFMFVLQLPAAFCNVQRSRPRKCNPDPVLPIHRNKFTVHGLWPQLNGSKPPLYCHTNQSMNDTDLNAFRKDLLEYWPNLFSANYTDFEPSKWFWKHEWKKHGKCSSNKFPPLKYLEITLDLAKKYAKPIFDELQNRGIKPNGTTLLRRKDLQKIVMKLTGSYYPLLNIVSNGSHDHVLLDIKLCVQNDGVKLMNCNKVYEFAAP